jgi:predicted transcriptional regulator
LPELPKPNKDGNFPAIEYSRICIARSLIRDRKGLGLSQQRLAELAHVRQETISRLESGKHTASVSSIEKIDAAIEAERKRQKKRNGR